MFHIFSQDLNILQDFPDNLKVILKVFDRLIVS